MGGCENIWRGGRFLGIHVGHLYEWSNLCVPLPLSIPLVRVFLSNLPPILIDYLSKQPRIDNMLLHKRKPEIHGRVYVEKLEAFEKFINDPDPVESTSRSSIRRHTGAHRLNASSSSAEENTRRQMRENHAFLEREIREKELRSLEKTRDIVERSVHSEAERKEKRLQKNLSSIEETKRMLDTIDHELKINDETNHNNNRRQFEDWNLNVHGKIQTKILEQLDQIDTKTLNKKKCEDYQTFIDISNRKPAIFRDIIIESEYDPLEPNRHALRAKTGSLKDPTLMLLKKTQDEAGMLGDGRRQKAFKITSKQKDGLLPAEVWASGKIEGTPHGRFMKMMNVKPKNTPTMKSNWALDDYNFPRGKAVVDAEMPKGKRPYPKNVDWHD